jgi:hypothetical protein
MPTGRLCGLASESPFGGDDDGAGVANSTVGLCFAMTGFSGLASSGTSLFGFVGFSSFSSAGASSLIFESLSSFTLVEDFFFLGDLGGVEGLLFLGLEVAVAVEL